MAGEAGMAIVVDFAKKAIQLAIDATIRHLGYMFCYKSNVENLKQCAEDLEVKSLDVEKSSVSLGYNNEEATAESTHWLIKTQAAKDAADVIKKDTENLKMGCWFPNPVKRYQLGRKAVKEAARIEKLKNEGIAYAPSHISAPPPAKLTGAMGNDLSNDYESRAIIMNDIMEALTNHKLSIIAVCGSGGVGKTTLMHELRERAIVNGLFHEVAMVVVSQTPDLSDIRCKLAEMLGLSSVKDKKNDVGIADAIHRRLTGKERKSLVILDDIWDEIDLKELGIPIRSDQPQCKVVLTSRNSGICNQMNSQKNISVEIMPPEEAWNLFKKMVGTCMESDDLKEIAEEVVQECGGLPIALVTVARALSNKVIDIWKDALKQLREHRVTTIPGMEKMVYSSIKLSYDSLAREVPEANLLLLLCCQLPEDAEIEVEILARHCLALRLFENVDTLCDARGRVTSLIEHLKGCFLLEAVDGNDNDQKLEGDKVKMHDIVRDVGCSIVSSSNEESERVHMWNGKKKTNGGNEVRASEGDYRTLKILLQPKLYYDEPIGRRFFSQMEELRVLEFCQSGYWRVEDEEDDEDNGDDGVELLTSLRMLFITLDKVHYQETLSKIERLTKLEVLSAICPSYVCPFPNQIIQLRHLKLLDLRFMTSALISIPRGILPELKKLEMLYLGFYYFSRTPGDGEHPIEGEKNADACISELSMMPNLMSLQIQLLSPMQLLHLPSEKLERFHFRVSDSNSRNSTSRNNLLVWRELEVEDFDIDLRMTEKLLLLFTKMEYLSVSEPGKDEVTAIFQNKNLPVGIFGNLRTLDLNNLYKLRHFLVGPTDPLCLPQLQKLKVTNCVMMGGIVSKGDVKSKGKAGEITEGATNFILHFPKLREVEITFANRFQGLYDFYDEDSMREPLIISPLVMLPSLEKLGVCYLGNLKKIVGGINTDLPKCVASDWLQNLQLLDVYSCRSLESVFDFEGIQLMAEYEQVVILGKLREIGLKDLYNLTCIFRCRMQDVSVPQLQKIDVDRCHKLRNLVASNLIKLLLSLQVVKIQSCETMEAVFDFDGFEVMNDDALFILGELQVIELRNLLKLEHVCRLPPKEIHVFQSLTRLSVDSCASLNYLLSSSVAQSLVSLESLIIEFCKSMNECIRMDEEQSGEKLVFRSLKSIRLVRMRSLSSFCSSDQQEFEFPSLQQVLITGCPQMKIFCHGHLTAYKLHGVESYLDAESYWNSDHYVTGVQSVWNNDLNETVHHINKRTLEYWDDLMDDVKHQPEVKLHNMEILDVEGRGYITHILDDESIDIHMIVASNWLRNLRQIIVSDCESLESVFNFEGIQSIAENAHAVTLTELQEISLDHLNALECIFRCRVQDVSIPKLEGINICDCRKLVNLFPSAFLKLLHSLKRVTVSRCFSMEAMFAFEGLEVTSKDSNVILGEVQVIEVNCLPKLEHICRLPPKEVSVFQNLTKLYVSECGSLSYLISSSVAQSLVNLESLYIECCDSMKECISMEEDYSGKQIVFCSLKSIELDYLEELSSFCASDLQEFDFPSLEKLVIKHCPELKTFCFGLMTADKLHGVDFGTGECVWMTNLDETLQCFNTGSDKENNNGDTDSNEGTSFPDASSLASSSCRALVVYVPSTSSITLPASSRNSYPKEDDCRAAIAAMDNITGDGDDGGIPFPDASSLASSSSPALIDYVPSAASIQLPASSRRPNHVTLRNSDPKEDDCAAAIAAVDSITRDGDGDENVHCDNQGTSAYTQATLSSQSEIFPIEATERPLHLRNTSMQANAEKALYDILSSHLEVSTDATPMNFVGGRGDHIDALSKPMDATIDGQAQRSNKQMVIGFTSPVPSNHSLPHQTTQIPPTQHPIPPLHASTHSPTLPPISIQPSTSTHSTTSSFEIGQLFAAIQAMSHQQIASQLQISQFITTQQVMQTQLSGQLSAAIQAMSNQQIASQLQISQLITSQQAMQTQLSAHQLSKGEGTITDADQTLVKNVNIDLKVVEEKVSETIAPEIEALRSRLESMEAQLTSVKSLMDTVVEEMKKKSV